MRKSPDNNHEILPVEVPIEDVLDLHTFLPSEIPSLLEEYLKACKQQGVYSVRIIHGKGKGFLKNRVHGLLERSPVVASFADAPASAGGWGATTVELKRQVSFDSPEWAQFLAQGARDMGMDLKPGPIRQFAIHARELMAWNKSVNLTAITDHLEVAEKHFLDTLPLGSVVPEQCAVLDIGSGGGIPGIPLRIVRPDLHLTLIDASRKKVSFLRHVIRMLDLKGIEARQVRAEELGKEHDAKVGPYDVVISRATSKLGTFLHQALPLLHRPGQIVAMKGASVAAELEGVGSLIKDEDLTVNTKTYRLPHLGIERTLIVFGKK